MEPPPSGAGRAQAGRRGLRVGSLWLLLLVLLPVLLLHPQGVASSSATTSSAAGSLARKRAAGAGKAKKAVPAAATGLGKRKRADASDASKPTQGKQPAKGGKGTAAADVDGGGDDEEEEIDAAAEALGEALQERSLNKYVAADPLWTGQCAASGLAWALLLLTPKGTPPVAAASLRRVLMVLAVRHALGLAADVRRVLGEAVEGDVDRARLRKLARGLTRRPGPPAYLLYAAAFLVLPPTASGREAGALSSALGPLLLREAFTALALGLDVLQILGVSSEAPTGGRSPAVGPRRPMPASLSTVSLALETMVGISLALSVLRTWNEGGALHRRVAAVLLYANFLYNRAGHVPGLRAALSTRSVGKGLLSVLKPILSDIEPASRQLTALGRATMARLDTVPGGDKVRSGLRLLGFLDDDEDDGGSAQASEGMK